MIEMDVLFTLPALPAAGFLAWKTAGAAARLTRSGAAWAAGLARPG